MQTQRKIIHIDMDAFYASVEQRDFPEYIGKPIIVGGKPEGRGGVGQVAGAARGWDEVCEIVAMARGGFFLPRERGRDFCRGGSAGGMGAARARTRCGRGR